MHFRHILGLDVIRLAAVMMVMIYHFVFWNLLPHQSLSAFSCMSDLEWGRYMHWGWVGVEIFFVISGFVIAFTSSNAHPMAFLQSRLFRLAPANWIAATIILALLPLIGAPDVPLWRHLLTYGQTLVFWPLNAMDGVWWTLGIEINFYLFVWCLIKLNYQDRLELIAFRWSCLSFLFWVITLSVSFYFRGQSSEFDMNIEKIANKVIGNRYMQLMLIQHAPFFALGIATYRAATDGIIRDRFIRIILLIAACLLEIIGQNDLIARNATIALSPVPALVIWTAAMATFAASIAWNEQVTFALVGHTRAIRFVGVATYPMYLLSNSVGTAVLLIGLPLHGVWAVWEAVVAGFATALIVAWLPEPLVRRALMAAWPRIDRIGPSYTNR